MRAYAPAAGANVHACGCLCVAPGRRHCIAQVAPWIKVWTGERMRRYTSAYVPMQNNAPAQGHRGAFVIGWNACAGLESSTCLNFDGDSRRMRPYALGATGDRSINSCADSRRMRAYTRTSSIKPGLMLQSAWKSTLNMQTYKSA